MPNNKIVGAAYDLKASLDLAAAFLRGGLTVEVFSGGEYRARSDTQAVIYNTESFFMQPEEEYAFLKRLFQSAPEGTCCFMKTDSSLRGNVGGELAALRDARGIGTLLFVPAFPKTRKFTQNGVQYQLEGEGEQRNILADAPRLIRSFRETQVSCGPVDQAQKAVGGIYVADCSSKEDFDGIVEALKAKRWEALAGTSALAEKLAAICHLETGSAPALDAAAIRLDGKPGMLCLSTLEWKKVE